MGRVYSLVLAAPIVLLALLELRAGLPAAGALEQGVLAQVAPVPAHGPRFSSAQDGQRIFRYDPFGDEHLCTVVLRMQEVVATVPPATALAVGLKVDVGALPPAVIDALRAGQVDLSNPAVT